MIRRLAMGVAIMLVCTIASSPAFAKHHHKKIHHRTNYQISSSICQPNNDGRQLCENYSEKVSFKKETHVVEEGSDPRPHLWCAWWLRRYLHIPKSAFPPYEYNLARAFAKIGSPAPKGCTGCIAVFSRGRGGHVGLVKEWDANGNPVILSGNYNGRVETAAHSKNRLIALRWYG